MPTDPPGVTGPQGQASGRVKPGAPPGPEGPVGGSGLGTPMHAWARLNRVFSHVLPGHFHRADQYRRQLRRVVR